MSPHTERLARDCTGCHGVNKWNDVPNFDHAKTAYVLTGKHVKLECASCHKNGLFGRTESSKSGLHYASIAFDECSSCHKDPHVGRFGAGCADCHVSTDFRNVPRDRFEHARTRFPLRGAHAKVNCDRCHDPAKGGWGKKPAFDQCSSCHTDAHAGTATLAGAVVDCDKCHGERAFTPATFDVVMHARTRYVLEGRHADVQCTKCHTHDRTDAGIARLGKAAVELRPASAVCRDCHADDHAGQLADRSDGGACESCHTAKGWKPSTFGVTQHARTEFALVGVHVLTECAKCHGVNRTGLRPHDPTVDPGKAAIILSLPERLCSDCHIDVHKGRYLSNGKSSTLGPCETCHTQDSFMPARVSSSDHDKYPFRLEGAHRATPCFLCHKELDSTSHLPADTHGLIAEPAPPDVVLWELASACQSCHRAEVPK
jgi:hypothetical protein